MFRTATARALGGYREEFPCAQDYDFFWRLCDAWGGGNLAEPLYPYRYHRGAVSARRAGRAGGGRIGRRGFWRRHGGRAKSKTWLARWRPAEAEGDLEPLRASLKQIDHQMLAGNLGAAGRAYAGLLKAHPASRLAWGKLLRWAVFASVPPAREWCFR